MDDLTRFCCQNPECPDYGKGGPATCRSAIATGPTSNAACCIVPRARPGFANAKVPRCSERRLPEEEIVSVLAHIAEGCGVRKTSRLVGVNKNTVVRYSVLAGEHAKDLHDELVAFSPSDARGPVRRKMGVRRQEGEEL